jgi:membrane fusion protein (multidrug efflux system)
MVRKILSEKLQNMRLLFLIGACLIVLIALGIWWWIHLSTHVKTDDSTIVGHLHPISPRIPGTVIGVYVLDNQFVKKGQLLVQLDPRDYETQVMQAQAALETARAQAQATEASVPLSKEQYQAQVMQAQGGLAASIEAVGQSQKNLQEARAAVITSRANLTQAEAQLAQAREDLRRYNIVDPRAVTAQQRDVTQTAYEAALANYDAAQANVQQALARVGQIQREIEANRARVMQARGALQAAKSQTYQVKIQQRQATSSRASVKQAEAALKQALLNLSYTRITAPVSGRVGRKTVEVGQRLQPGQPVLTIVEPLLWVVANLKETQMERVRPGQPVDIHVDSFPRHHFKGVVDSIAPASGAQFALLPPDNATGNFTKIVQRIPVKIWFTSKSVRGYENLLVPGMSTVVTIDTTQDR